MDDAFRKFIDWLLVVTKNVTLAAVLGSIGLTIAISFALAHALPASLTMALSAAGLFLGAWVGLEVQTARTRAAAREAQAEAVRRTAEQTKRAAETEREQREAEAAAAAHKRSEAKANQAHEEEVELGRARIARRQVLRGRKGDVEKKLITARADAIACADDPAGQARRTILDRTIVLYSEELHEIDAELADLGERYRIKVEARPEGPPGDEVEHPGESNEPGGARRAAR